MSGSVCHVSKLVIGGLYVENRVHGESSLSRSTSLTAPWLSSQEQVTYRNACEFGIPVIKPNPNGHMALRQE